jgi:hypothetical protein
LVANDVDRLAPGSVRFVPAYIAVLLASFILTAVSPAYGERVFATLIAAFAAVEAAVWRFKDGVRREARWLGAAAFLFALGGAFWLGSRRDESLLCSPPSLLQGHAAWHLLCALAAGCLYLYVEAELAGVESPPA